MKTARAKRTATAFDDIVETLRRVPKARLGAVRAVVQALAAPADDLGHTKKRTGKRISLVDSPFCGMWKDREDIVDGQTFARQLRERAEKREDRRKNLP
jgi:hypothetical protein